MSRARHRLVAIGDSLTQGFRSGAIERVDRSFPAMLAAALGAAIEVPAFEGAGGLPINLERLLRALGERYGARIRPWHVPGMLLFARSRLDEVEDHWERGPGAGPQGAPARHHVLAVWGFEADDPVTLTDRLCRLAIRAPTDELLRQLPTDAMYRTARRVLNPRLDPARENAALVDRARELARDGGIENLVVFLGANNALGTVTSLEVRDVPAEDLDLPRPRRRGALSTPEGFAYHYARLAGAIDAIGAERVFVGTVPHVTVPPVTRGVSPRGGLTEDPQTGRRYFAYYTRPWIWDPDFDPDMHEHLTRAQAIGIDRRIDAFNRTIRETAHARGWIVVDTCALLDDLAWRAHGGHPPHRFPPEAIDALARNPRLAYLVHAHSGARRVALDTRFFHLVPTQGALELPYLVDEGGLFGLDGMHPTTIGYALIAERFHAAMREAGVPDLAPLDWDRWLAADTLVGTPPRMMCHLRRTLRRMDRHGWLSRLLREF